MPGSDEYDIDLKEILKMASTLGSGVADVFGKEGLSESLTTLSKILEETEEKINEIKEQEEKELEIDVESIQGDIVVCGVFFIESITPRIFPDEKRKEVRKEIMEITNHLLIRHGYKNNFGDKLIDKLIKELTLIEMETLINDSPIKHHFVIGV